MKKLGAIILSLILMISVLTACGGGSSSSSSSSSGGGDGTWPTGAVTILVGFGAGGSSDLGVRSLCTYLEKVTGGTFVVSNVTGANGWMAWDQLLHSDPDGCTLALVNTPSLFYDYMDPSQGHKETMDDFDFICNEVMDYGVLVTKKGAYADMAAFMEAAKAEGGLTVADVGANGNKHIATVQLGAANPDCTLTPVHQGGFSDNTAALLGGTVDAVSAVYGDMAAVLADGEYDILCVFNNERIDVLPDVPTCEEAGFGAVYEQVSRGYMLPKGVDPAMKEAIVAAFKEAIPMEEHLAELENLGLIEVGNGSLNFNFPVAERCLEAGLTPDIISSDSTPMTFHNNPAMWDLSMVLSKFLNLGVPFPDAVRAVTVTPAKLLRMENAVGTIAPGYEADLAVFRVDEEPLVFRDSAGNERTGPRGLVPVMTICRGQVVWQA